MNDSYGSASKFFNTNGTYSLLGNAVWAEIEKTMNTIIEAHELTTIEIRELIGLACTAVTGVGVEQIVLKRFAELEAKSGKTTEG